MKKFTLIALLATIIACSSEEGPAPAPPAPETMYFPDNGSTTWETSTVANLGWDESQVEPLLDYLEEKHTKSFIVLVDGQIVMEHYFNGHSAATPWYWASAGKTLTATVTGIAQQEGFLNINDKVSDYLGTGWTSAPLSKRKPDHEQALAKYDSRVK